MAAPGGGRGGPEEAEGLVLGRLEEEALKRRERLKALRQRTLQNKESGEPESKIPREDEEEEPVKHREIKLRNYDPEDAELKKRKLPPAKPASGGRNWECGKGKGGLGSSMLFPRWEIHWDEVSMEPGG
ncbi:hypothetical protein IHE44_0000042, partial [Lamprotornis superbus]